MAQQSSSGAADQMATLSGQQVLLKNLSLFSAGIQSAASQQLVNGLGGAIGSDYRPAGHQLVFVEFNGKLSRLNLIPSASTLSTGTVTLQGTYLFDFDGGTHSAPGEPIVPPYDVWWNQQTSTERQLVPVNGAQIVRLGAVNYNTISYAELLGLAYSTTPIDGSVGAGNQLTNGTVFAVRTADGNYAKALVLNYGYNLEIRWTTYQVDPMYEVLGTGYDQPEDVKVTADEAHAYVTERSGNVLRVSLANADRAFATVVSSGMTAPHQMVLDEAHNAVYLVEFAPAGRLIRVDLTSGARTPIVTGLDGAIGLLMTQDGQYAYVAEQGAGGRVTRIRLSSGHREVLVTGLTAPFMMTWTDPGESGILIAERDPANRITRIDLANLPVTATQIADVPFRPSSVAVVNPTRLLVCCDEEIAQVELTGSVYTPTGPMLLGIGHVPVDRISRTLPVADPATDGYADTSADAGYFFQVKDAPFGGTLPIMFNHERAYDEGARWYRLYVDGVAPEQGFTDYQWSTSANRFVAQAVNPSASGFYRVRPPSELWYNHWLGYMLNTLGLGNGLHTITIRLYASQSNASEIGSEAAAGRSCVVQIDNTQPVVKIEKIFHGVGVNEVGACGIVDSGTDEFTFQITAADAEQHMAHWSLVALWGDNKSAVVDQDSYAAHVSPTRKWAGPSSQLAPIVAPQPWHAAVPGDPSSTHCAHTFQLSASSRVINGWNALHWASAHKSITIMLP